MGTKANPSEWDCYVNAEEDEPMFVLLARDSIAPEIVRVWADMRADRVRVMADNATGAEVLAELDQIAEARRCADDMEKYRAARDMRVNVPGFPVPDDDGCLEWRLVDNRSDRCSLTLGHAGAHVFGTS